MSDYYNARRTRNLFDPKSTEPFKVSRSKIDLFLNCPRCFYLDCRLGVARPPGFPFALNSAVDALLKKEFDIHRAKKRPHPLMQSYGLRDVVPFQHEDLELWRSNFKGIRFLHEPTNLLVTGAIDDIWTRDNGELIIVDYKSTSKVEKVSLDKEWQIGYKRQMEVYQWLFRQNGFNVSSTGYFVYCNGKTDREAFDAKLEFDIDLIPYTGNDAWIVPALADIRLCLMNEKVPSPAENCDYCNYRKAARDVQRP
ncbi:MAG: PD-(D/E)XK nuclease family protein [Patescibacteria group bacterium]|nr:PD-(D/E)XK nuclease family protein [Patescibacteria group bacterium]MDE2172501.1 PD-(D/E)XK nuclease family protein [Patescibacteria group bacterium]